MRTRRPGLLAGLLRLLAPGLLPGLLLALLASPALAERLERTVRHDGLRRSYIVHLPPDLQAQEAWPVILAFHPGWGTAARLEETTRLHEAPGAEGYVVVYPDGFRRTWNVGYCCGRAAARGIDDLGFVDAILADLATLAPLRPRVFVTGFSNGAMLAYLLMCERADRIAAAAPFGAVLDLGRASCRPAAPVPLLHMHGLEDPRAPFAGGRAVSEAAGDQPPVEEVVGFWAARDGCGGAEAPVALLPGADCEAHRGCEGGAEVVLCAIPGLGHLWPGEAESGASRAMDLGPSRPDLDGSAAVLAFFERHR